MSQYFTTPFPFKDIIEGKAINNKVDMETSIRVHIRSLILMRVGEFGYDRSQGFEMWDYDKEVFFHDREPYFEGQKKKKGLLENAHARKHFKDNLRSIIEENELRLQIKEVHFNFEKVDGNLSVYQRRIVIDVSGRIKTTGKPLTPPFRMSILYTPFHVETN